MHIVRLSFLVLLFSTELPAQPPHASIVKGAVTIRHGEAGSAVPLDASMALQEGDHLISGLKSTAVILLDGAHSFQLAADSEARIARMDGAHFDIEVLSGGLTYHVEGPSAADVNVHTPTVAVHPSQMGVYSVALKPGGTSEIIPRAGNVEVFAPGGSQWVYTGQKMVARGDPANPEFRITRAGSRFLRAMILLSNIMQAVDVAGTFGSGGGGGGEGHQKTASGSKPAPKEPAPHPPAPAPSHPPATPPASRSGK